MLEFPHGFHLYLPYPLTSHGKMSSSFLDGMVSIKANIKKGRGQWGEQVNSMGVGVTPPWGENIVFTLGQNITLSLIQYSLYNIYNIKNIKLNAGIITANCQYKTVILVIKGRI